MHGYRTSVAERQANGTAGTIPGHEPAGIVHQVGEGVTNVQVGDRVAIYHYRGCGHCHDCRGGDLMWCEDRRGYGGPIHGSDAELLITDALNCLPLPDSVSFAMGAMLMCVGGTAFQVMTKLDARVGSTIAVFGLGPVGLAGMLFAQAMGADVIGVDMSPYRLELASKLGARQVVDGANQEVRAAIQAFGGKGGVSAAFESSGSPIAQASTVDVTGRRGKIAFVGFGSGTPSITPSTLIDKQLTLMGSFVFPINAYEDILGFVQRYDVPLESMVTHTVSLDDSPAMFPALDRGETGKVIIAP
jgi:propanol-preferring alcohol dehydrogenase